KLEEHTTHHVRQDKLVASFCAVDQPYERPGEQRARTEQHVAAGRRMEQSGHGHLRWNSGAINTNVNACALLSARATAWRVVADASGPSAVSRTAAGSIRALAFCAKALAASSRWARPSSQAPLSSENPLGAGGRQSGS